MRPRGFWRARGNSFFVLAATVAALGPAAQTIRQEPHGTGEIAGVVVAAGEPRAREPVSEAEVTLVVGDISRTQVTGADGAFAFTGLPAGRYVLCVAKSGYLTSEFGGFRPGEQGTPLAAGDGQPLTQLFVPLSRPAVISGVIRIDGGEPASNVRVIARSGAPPQGTTRAQTYEAVADRSGAYRISGVPPGEYVVSAAPSMTGGRSTPIFFPGTANPAQAGKVSVAAGEEHGSIDFQLLRAGTARITGTVLGPDATPVGSVFVTVETELDVIQQVRSVSDGTFVVSGLHAGPYRLTATQTGPRVGTARTTAQALADLAPALWAQQSVEVPYAGRVDATLSLLPTATWSGEIAFDDPRPDPSGRLDTTVALTALDRRALPAMAQASDGTFRITGIVPGRYRLEAQVQGDGTWWLKSAEAGGRSLLAGPLVVESDAESVPSTRLVLSRARATLTGVLLDRADQPATDYWVAAFPTDRGLWHPGSPRLVRARPATNGQYLFEAIPAGEYLLAVFGDIHPRDWQDAWFLASLSGQAVRVQAPAGARATQDIRIAR
jgi:hypothetical protein